MIDLERLPDWGSDGPLLSVIVPVFNEVATVELLIGRLVNGPYPDKEIIVVDDGSTDGTRDAIARWDGRSGVRVVTHSRNRGKGAAVRSGMALVRGAITIIQDADLEYDPNDYPRVIEPIRRGVAKVVYGSRYMAPESPLPWSRFRVAVAGLNLLIRILYGQRITDSATCYKAFRTGLLHSLDLRAERFELCPEMTAKVCRLGIRIIEVPISYRPRSRSEGKKIGWRDARQAVWTLIRWRFARFRSAPRATPTVSGTNDARPPADRPLAVGSPAFAGSGVADSRR